MLVLLVFGVFDYLLTSSPLNAFMSNFEGLLHHPFCLRLVLALFKLLYLAKDHWRGFCIRNAHMVQIVN